MAEDPRGTAPAGRGAPEVRRNGVVALAGGGFLIALLAVAAPLQGPPPQERPGPELPATRPVDEVSPSPDRVAPSVGVPAAEVAAPVGDGVETVAGLTAVTHAPESAAAPAEAVDGPSAPITADPTEHLLPTPPPSAGDTRTHGPEGRPTHEATRPAAPPTSSRSPRESDEPREPGRSGESRESKEPKEPKESSSGRP